MDVADYLTVLPPAEARAKAIGLAATHYENFAVSSRFIPAELRERFALLYAFCRATDDLGDEAPGDRLALLATWRTQFEAALGGAAEVPWPLAGAAELVTTHGLPAQYFRDLILANERDQTVTRHADWDALQAYAALSANCVGRLVLRIFGIDDPECDRRSDAVCTGLQYANFWQDIKVDIGKGRIYVPESEWRAAGLGEADFGAPEASPGLRALVREKLLPRTRALFDEGDGLIPLVPVPLRRQMTLYLGGGRAILAALEKQDCDPLVRRPVVSKFTKAALLAKAWFA